MSGYTERAAGWSTDPAPPGAEVRNHPEIGPRVSTRKMNDDDDEYVALFSWDNVRREGIPDEIVTAFDSHLEPSLHRFTDRANPFYSHREHLYAVKREMLQPVMDILESKGYEYEVKLGQAQFKFIPRPTVGEIIVKDKNAQS